VADLVYVSPRAGSKAVRSLSGADERGHWACGSARTTASVSFGPAAAGGAQERRADGSQARPPTCAGAASVVAPFRRPGALVGAGGDPVARDHALAALERHAPVAAWVIDDTGIPKKGSHSVGVAHQYCGVLGKSANCQVAVTVSLVNATLSVPSGFRLYLPKEWADDPSRRRAAGVPPEVEFRTKGMIALAEIDELLAEEIPLAPVVADAGYGASTAFREALTERGFSYAVGILPDTSLWAPGEEPLPPRPWKGQGRPPKLLRRSTERQPVLARELAKKLPRTAWKTVRWREGTKGTMASQFAAIRVRVAHRDYERSGSREPEWFLVQWPAGEKEPTGYWLSTVPEDVPLEDLVRLAKIRWRIERDFQELKDELGLDHYEGRGWRGFHHHAALCIAAYAFLTAERARLSPPAPVAFLHPARLPKDFRPRGATAS